MPPECAIAEAVAIPAFTADLPGEVGGEVGRKMEFCIFIFELFWSSFFEGIANFRVVAV